MFLFGPPQPLGTSEVIPPPSGWAARTDVPASINPAGTLWLVEKEWTFDGPAGSPPPAPWRNGPRWAGGHATLGGHVWRDQVNLADKAYLDGNGNLILRLEWNATHSTAVGAYLLTDHDGGAVLAENYRVDPTADDGVYIEYEAALPSDQPRASWCALWTYATIDPTYTPLTDTALLAIYGGTDLASLEYLREEIDVMEHFGNHGATFVDRFVSNFHGRHSTLCDDGALVAGYVKGEGFKPSWWGGTSANNGAFHKWGIMWTPRTSLSSGEQKLFYDGYNYLNRPASTKVCHNQAHGLRLSWETQVYPDGTSNPFGGGVVPPSTETDKFPREMKVANVRVLRRRLAPTGWSITALSADKAEGNS